MLAKVPDDRRFKSGFGAIFTVGACRGAETDAATAGVAERGVTGENFDPGTARYRFGTPVGTARTL